MYSPLEDDPHEEFWDALLTSLSQESDGRVLLLGDLNACALGLDTPASRLFSAKHFDRIPETGFIDLWREVPEATACTWAGSVNPFRLDHAFGTSAIVGGLINCDYDHSVRENGLSDHFLLEATLDL